LLFSDWTGAWTVIALQQHMLRPRLLLEPQPVLLLITTYHVPNTKNYLLLGFAADQQYEKLHRNHADKMPSLDSNLEI
jgi:hypothetical protein